MGRLRLLKHEAFRKRVYAQEAPLVKPARPQDTTSRPFAPRRPCAEIDGNDVRFVLYKEQRGKGQYFSGRIPHPPVIATASKTPASSNLSRAYSPPVIATAREAQREAIQKKQRGTLMSCPKSLRPDTRPKDGLPRGFQPLAMTQGLARRARGMHVR